nr:Inner membrane protein yccS [Klebsiella pneumoniae]
MAAALTDLDDRLAGRLRNLAITLVCFFIASASVELLFPWPPLFALGLTVSTIGFILLGGLGQRYATIAFGALLIAIYTMLGVTLYDHWYLQPLFLLAGAVWYNLLTLSGHLIFPIRPLQDNRRVAMSNWPAILSSNPGCLILTLRMRARRRCTIWRSLMASW